MPETKTLTCILTPAELTARGSELARANMDWSSAEEEKKSITKSLGDIIKNHEVNMKRLAMIIKNGKEEREVEIEWVPYPSSETMRCFRKDTGEEISSRPMRQDEKDAYRQPPLPLPQPLALPAAGPIAPAAPAPVLLIEDKGDAIDGEFEVIQ